MEQQFFVTITILETEISALLDSWFTHKHSFKIPVL